MEKHFESLTLARHSVRAYRPQAIEEEKIDYIMECVRQAPSAVNKQPWRFLLLRSPEAQVRIRRCYDREWFAQAPLYVLCCADHSQSWHRPSDGKDHADIDLAIATEHLCLAAADCGIGSCWVCNFNTALCRELFRLSENVEPVAIVSLGYSAETTPAPRRRKEMNEIVESL